MNSIDAQVNAVARSVANLRGLIERHKELAAINRWPAGDIEIRKAHLAVLEDAEATLRMLSKHWDAFEQAMMEHA